MSVNLKKLELEKNNFIRDLSQEQFDLVITNKYKKVFLDYFNGNISDVELKDKIDSNLELISIYETDTGKIDSNQYLYSAIVEVALNYFNVANEFETCLNKCELIASYFNLVASVESKLKYLNDVIADVFYIHNNITDKNYLDKKLSCVSGLANNISALLDEISIYENIIVDIENKTKKDFLDELHIKESFKELYVMVRMSFTQVNCTFRRLQDDCADESTGVKLDIMKGEFKG